MDCKDRFVRTGDCSSGSAGRLERWIIPFLFDVLGDDYCISLIWGSISCQVEPLIFSPVCQVDSIWIIIRSKRPLCISPFLSQGHLWPPRWLQSPALTSLLNHHISDSLSYQRWMECLQTGKQTRHRQEALWEAQCYPPSRACRGGNTGASLRPACFHLTIWIATHNNTFCVDYELPAALLVNIQDESLSGFNILDYQEYNNTPVCGSSDPSKKNKNSFFWSLQDSSIFMFLPSFELGTFCMWCKRDKHYTTETTAFDMSCDLSHKKSYYLKKKQNKNSMTWPITNRGSPVATVVAQG